MTQPVQIERDNRAATGLGRHGARTRWWLGVLALLLSILLFAALFWPDTLDGVLAVALPTASAEMRAAIRAVAGSLLLFCLLKIAPRVARWVRRQDRGVLGAGPAGEESADRVPAGMTGIPGTQRDRSAWLYPRGPQSRRLPMAGLGTPGVLGSLPSVSLGTSRLFRAQRPLDMHLCDLEGEYLERAYLAGGALHGANLRAASLGWATLLRADLTFADLGQAFLAAADLRGADLTGANLRGAYLDGADLRGADLSLADLRGAHLRKVNLQGAQLVSAWLHGANLQGANMEGADLRRAVFPPGQLRGVTSLTGTWMPDGRLHP